MSVKVKKYISSFLFICLALMLPADELSAANPIKRDSAIFTLHLTPPSLSPVMSCYRSGSEAIDTLDTANEFVKVIIFADNTWEYYKTPEYQAITGVYDEAWIHAGTDPYGIPQSQLPDQWTIWCVDSLDQFHCPYQGNIFSKFGARRGRRHQGVDIPLKTGDPVHAAFTGKVRVSKYWGAYGNVVVIRHENGIETFYAHLSQRLVENDDWVNAGDVIGYGGSTGRSSGPHLHFETRFKGYAFDPQWLIDFKEGKLRQRLFVLKKKYFDIYSNYEQNFDDEILNEEDDKREQAEREAMRWYTIKSGDTLGHIALKNGTTIDAICRLNGITRSTTLKIGRKIRVK